MKSRLPQLNCVPLLLLPVLPHQTRLFTSFCGFPCVCKILFREQFLLPSDRAYTWEWLHHSLRLRTTSRHHTRVTFSRGWPTLSPLGDMEEFSSAPKLILQRDIHSSLQPEWLGDEGSAGKRAQDDPDCPHRTMTEVGSLPFSTCQVKGRRQACGE